MKMTEKGKNIKKVPNLRFPEFSEVWEKKKLGEITERIGDGLHGTPLYVEESEYYFINGNNLINGKIELNENTKRVSKETYSKNNKGLNENSLLISINGTIGNIAKYNNESVMLGKSVGYFNFKENSTFFYFILQSKSVQRFFYSELTGSTIKNLSLKTLRETKVVVPHQDEQNKISLFLSNLDEKIETQRKTIEELITLKKGLAQKIFSQELRFKDDEGNEFSEWRKVKLKHLATITTGSSNRVDSILDGQYVFFDRSQDIRTSNRYLFDKEAVIVPGEGQEFFPKYFIGKFDLHQRTYAIFDFKNLYGKYLFYHLLNDDRHLQSQAVGSTVKSLRLPMFQSMPIKLPSLPEQQKISNFLSSIDEKIEVENQLLQKLEEQKKYFLANLFI